MNAKTSENKPADTDDSEAKDSRPSKKAEVEQAKAEIESGTASSPAMKRQDTLLLFGKIIDRRLLERKDKEELIEIIFDLNAELVRTTSRLGEEGRERAFKMDSEVKQFVRVPASSGRAASDQDQLPSGWRIVLVSSQPKHKPLGLEVCAPVIVGRREGNITPQIDLTEHDAVSLGVSRFHALIRPTKTSLLLTDLRSTNGTFHNATRLEPAVAQELKDGDTIAFGQLIFKVRIVRPPDAKTTESKDKP